MPILVLPSPQAPPSLTGWAFVLGRRTRAVLQVVVAMPATATPASAPDRVAQ